MHRLACVDLDFATSTPIPAILRVVCPRNLKLVSFKQRVQVKFDLNYVRRTREFRRSLAASYYSISVWPKNTSIPLNIADSTWRGTRFCQLFVMNSSESEVLASGQLAKDKGSNMKLFIANRDKWMD